MKTRQLTALCLRDALASREGKHIRQAMRSLLGKCWPHLERNAYARPHLERMIRTLDCQPEDPRVDTLPLMFEFLFDQLNLLKVQGFNVDSLMADCQLFYHEYHRASHEDWMRLLASNSAELQVAA